jgi:hypothetical protein
MQNDPSRVVFAFGERRAFIEPVKTADGGKNP